MMNEADVQAPPKGLGIFEKYLTLWVILCIGAGIALGKIAPGVAKAFRDNILSTGGTMEPMQSYIKFRGKEPGIGPLLKRRGLDGAKE